MAINNRLSFVQNNPLQQNNYTNPPWAMFCLSGFILFSIFWWNDKNYKHSYIQTISATYPTLLRPKNVTVVGSGLDGTMKKVSLWRMIKIGVFPMGDATNVKMYFSLSRLLYYITITKQQYHLKYLTDKKLELPSMLPPSHPHIVNGL